MTHTVTRDASTPIGHGQATRREFFLRSALAAAGWRVRDHLTYGMIGGMVASKSVVPDNAAARRMTHAAWLPPAPPDEQFRALALIAMDSAKQAGADFADIRVGVQRQCNGPNALMMLGYGIRVRVGGAWSFEHGAVLSPDAVAASTRAAVVGARTTLAVNTRLGRAAEESFAAVPAATGDWSVPIEIDPFAVPVDDFLRAERSFAEPVKRLGLAQAWGRLQWSAETRVFASTDGSLVTQRWTRVAPLVVVNAYRPRFDPVQLSALSVAAECVGFEFMARTDMADRIVSAAEEAIRWAEFPLKASMDVGRFPVVFDGAAFANIVGCTVDLALDGDRLSGHEADAAGRSFLQPFVDHPAVHEPEFSPRFTLRTSRALPSASAAGWDDDGVVPVPTTLVDKGRVTDFHTTRDTAPVFDAWYRTQGRPDTLHGSAFAPTPASMPMCSGGDLRVDPASAKVSVNDLVRDVLHGFLVLGASSYAAPGLTAGITNGRLIFEIRNGKPVTRIGNLQMAFTTNAIFKTGLVALGDATTFDTSLSMTSKGMPWQEMTHPVTAPAAYCQEIDVLRTDLSR